MNIPTVLSLAIGMALTNLGAAVKPGDVKDKRGAISGTYSSPSSYGPPPDHGSGGGSGFTPISPSVGAYPHNGPSLGALLIPGNLVYGQGLDYSGLSYGGYGGLGSVPSSYPVGLNLGAVGSSPAYKLGPVTFNAGASPYGGSPSPLVGSSYPSYNLVSPITPEFAIGSAYAVPSYQSSGLHYSPNYASGGSAYSGYQSAGSSYSGYPSAGSGYSSYPSTGSSYSAYQSPGSSYSSYQSPGLGAYASGSYSSSPYSSSQYSSSPPYSAFVSSGGSAHSSYSSPSSSYSSSSSHSPSSSYSSPSGSSYSSYSGPSSSSYPSPVYGPPSYKGSSGVYSKY